MSYHLASAAYLPGRSYSARRTSRPVAGSRPGMGFTLIELLVVIAIIALLAAILFPVFAQARESARTTVCTSNVRQIAMSVRMYVQDNDDTFPIFQAYNTVASGGAPWTPGHLGVENELYPYVKNQQIFRCPDDDGGPATGKAAYFDTFGSSYRFDQADYTVTFGSYEDDGPVLNPATDKESLVTDSKFVYPANTRIMRDEMFPWFDPGHDTANIYGYGPYPGVPAGYYRLWHPRGGGIVYADGHAKFCAAEGAFQAIYGSPDGKAFPACWYGCD